MHNMIGDVHYHTSGGGSLGVGFKGSLFIAVTSVLVGNLTAPFFDLTPSWLMGGEQEVPKRESEARPAPDTARQDQAREGIKVHADRGVLPNFVADDLAKQLNRIRVAGKWFHNTDGSYTWVFDGSYMQVETNRGTLHTASDSKWELLKTK